VLILCTGESYGWLFGVCCVLSGRGLFDLLITCSGKSYGCLSVVIVVCCQVFVCARG